MPTFSTSLEKSYIWKRFILFCWQGVCLYAISDINSIANTMKLIKIFIVKNGFIICMMDAIIAEGF